VPTAAVICWTVPPRPGLARRRLLRPRLLHRRRASWVPLVGRRGGAGPPRPVSTYAATGGAVPVVDARALELLGHIVDGLRAFIQGAAGAVAATAPPALPRDPALLAGHLLDLGCGVLGEWVAPRCGECLLGPARIPGEGRLEAAALEIAVHGWDVSRVTAPSRELPAGLAAALLPVAVRRVDPGDRPTRFGPIDHGSRRDPAAILLNHLGRRADTP